MEWNWELGKKLSANVGNITLIYTVIDFAVKVKYNKNDQLLPAIARMNIAQWMNIIYENLRWMNIAYSSIKLFRGAG